MEREMASADNVAPDLRNISSISILRPTGLQDGTTASGQLLEQTPGQKLTDVAAGQTHCDPQRAELTVRQPQLRGLPYSFRPQNDEDWDLWKYTIETHYSQYNLPLRDVVKVMNERFGFSATPKMYRRQFDRWGVRKYKAKPCQGGLQSQTAIRSATRRAAILDELANLPQASLFPDELSKHKYTFDRVVLPFVIDTINRVGLFRRFSLWNTTVGMLRAFIAMQQGVENAHLQVGRAFDSIEQELATREPGALLMLCVMLPSLIWHLQDQIPCISEMLGIYVNHIADLSHERIREEHPINSLMLGLRHTHRSAFEHWESLMAPLLGQVDTNLMTEPEKTKFTIVLTQSLNDAVTAPLRHVVEWEVQTRQTVHIARGLAEPLKRLPMSQLEDTRSYIEQYGQYTATFCRLACHLEDMSVESTWVGDEGQDLNFGS